MYSGTLKEWKPNGSSNRQRVHVRWMIRRDMSEMLEIERESFEYPWPEDEFIRCLRQRECVGMIAEHAEQVVGFLIYQIFNTRLHVLSVAVAKDYRHRGVGSQMIEKLKDKLSAQRRPSITLEVRETNVAAQVFFAKCGFVATKILRDWYEESTEDAYLMQYFENNPKGCT